MASGARHRITVSPDALGDGMSRRKPLRGGYGQIRSRLVDEPVAAPIAPETLVRQGEAGR